jgi:hypothetical protein
VLAVTGLAVTCLSFDGGVVGLKTSGNYDIGQDVNLYRSVVLVHKPIHESGVVEVSELIPVADTSNQKNFNIVRSQFGLCSGGSGLAVPFFPRKQCLSHVRFADEVVAANVFLHGENSWSSSGVHRDHDVDILRSGGAKVLRDHPDEISSYPTLRINKWLRNLKRVGFIGNSDPWSDTDAKLVFRLVNSIDSSLRGFVGGASLPENERSVHDKQSSGYFGPEKLLGLMGIVIALCGFILLSKVIDKINLRPRFNENMAVGGFFLAAVLIWLGGAMIFHALGLLSLSTHKFSVGDVSASVARNKSVFRSGFLVQEIADSGEALNAEGSVMYSVASELTHINNARDDHKPFVEADLSPRPRTEQGGHVIREQRSPVRGLASHHTFRLFAGILHSCGEFRQNTGLYRLWPRRLLSKVESGRIAVVPYSHLSVEKDAVMVDANFNRGESGVRSYPRTMVNDQSISCSLSSALGSDSRAISSLPLQASEYSIYGRHEENSYGENSGDSVVILVQPRKASVDEKFHFHWQYLPFGIGALLLGGYGVRLLRYALGDKGTGIILLKGLGFSIGGWIAAVFCLFHWLSQT